MTDRKKGRRTSRNSRSLIKRTVQKKKLKMSKRRNKMTLKAKQTMLTKKKLKMAGTNSHSESFTVDVS